jgi:hypothetical protein
MNKQLGISQYTHPFMLMQPCRDYVIKRQYDLRGERNCDHFGSQNYPPKNTRIYFVILTRIPVSLSKHHENQYHVSRHLPE